MAHDGIDVLTPLVCRLVHGGAITLSATGIATGNMNPHENSAAARELPRLTKLLYQQIAASRLWYEMIVSIPTGGDEYALRLAALIKENEGRDIPCVPYKCLSPCEERRKRVLLVDDAIAFGTTATLAIQVARMFGYEVAAIAVGLDFERDLATAVKREATFYAALTAERANKAFVAEIERLRASRRRFLRQFVRPFVE
ncbi:MAG: phosphoribosyltransferase [Candidatus Kaiserbacteria bacterium]|nr:phosphoribosyltransferase [Candidatus Kaiserbacteria bacterium]